MNRRDAAAAAALSDGSIVVDPSSGVVYSTRSRWGACAPRVMLGHNQQGYRTHTLRVGDKAVPGVRAHRIVWISVNGGIPDGLMPDHINRNRSDNRIENLRLVNAAGNASNRRRYDGEANPRAKLSAGNVEQIRQDRAAGMTQAAIAQKFGVSRAQVWNITNGLQWRYGQAKGAPKAYAVRVHIEARQ